MYMEVDNRNFGNNNSLGNIDINKNNNYINSDVNNCLNISINDKKKNVKDEIEYHLNNNKFNPDKKSNISKWQNRLQNRINYLK